MDKLDQAYFKRHLERLKAEGLPAIWTGGQRHCGEYPALAAGMPGIYVGDENDGASMFYPAIWNHRYGVRAIRQDVQMKR
jgi:hypothetical protein